MHYGTLGACPLKRSSWRRRRRSAVAAPRKSASDVGDASDPLPNYVVHDIMYPKAWDVEFTDQLGSWWHTLTAGEQDAIDSVVGLLETLGPQLPFPFSSGVTTSRHRHLRELRIQYRGRPIRILYAFDPRRSAILLLGGDKTGDDRWYERHVPIADDLYDEHLRILNMEGLL